MTLPDRARLRDVATTPVQAFIDDTVQMHDYVRQILAMTGKADVVIATFSYAELFVRAVADMKAQGMIGSCTLIADARAAQKTVKLEELLRNTFDHIYMGRTHCKIVLINHNRGGG